MMAVGAVKRALVIGLTAAVLAGCGGGGSSGGSGGSGNVGAIPVPEAPSVTLTPQATKQFLFTWEDVANEAEYRLLEKPNNMSGYTQVAVIPADAESYSHTVFLPERVNASYILQACNSEGRCIDSAEQFVSGTLAEAVGYVKASNADRLDQFGIAVALSRDGTTLAVGAKNEDSSARGVGGDQTDSWAADSGAVYVFVRDEGGVWNQQAYLKASNTDAGDLFGWAVSLADDGNTLAVGARSEDSSASTVGGDQADNLAANSGAAYVFVRSVEGVWSQQAYVKASNSEGSDGFGDAVVLSGDGNTLAVGVSDEDSSARGIDGDQADNSAARSGAVYVYARSDSGTWTQRAYLKGSNSDVSDLFGFSVSLSSDGSVLAVGAFGEGSSASGVDGDQADNSATGAGAVYIFERADDGAWAQQAYVKASNPDVRDFFGRSVSLSGDGNTLAVGAPDEDSSATGIDEGQADNSAIRSGAVYVFVRSVEGLWSQQAYLKASNTDVEDNFGQKVSLSDDGDILAVVSTREASGAHGINGDQLSNQAEVSGAVYLFRRSLDEWSQQAYVKASNTDAFDEFGASVALSGDGRTLAVGAEAEGSVATGVNGDQADNFGLYNGAVYLY